MIDRWEDQLAKGITPDLTEGMPKEEREKIKAKIAEIEEAEKTRAKEISDAQMDRFFEEGGNDIAAAYLAETEFSDEY